MDKQSLGQPNLLLSIFVTQVRNTYRKQPSISMAVVGVATAAAAPPALWNATFLGIKDLFVGAVRPSFVLSPLSRLLKRQRGRVFVSYQSWNVWRRRMTRKGDGNLRL